MYVHLGEDTLLKGDDIIGIFDLDNTTVMKSTREYLKKASKEKRVVNVSYDSQKILTVSTSRCFHRLPFHQEQKTNQGDLNEY